jgi:flagella basal body P-ring formation protein FlgA
MRKSLFALLACLSWMYAGQPALSVNADGLAASTGQSNEVKTARHTRPLAEAELKDLLTSALQSQEARAKGTLELRLGRPWATIPVPDEPLSVRVLELPVAGLTPNFIVRFELRTSREGLGTFQMPLQARVWREVWVARSPQPRGRLLCETDLATERRDMLLLRDAFVGADLTNPALELAENLSSGSPLLVRSVRTRPVVRRGKVLEAVVQDGLMMITVKAEALEDGLPGQLIRVRNTKSRREFYAKVQNEQTVIVPL